KRAFGELDEDLLQHGTIFLKNLARSIYKEQRGRPVVDYQPLKDEMSWKTTFFGYDPKAQLLREVCPLIRNGSQYRFIHASLLEYCFTLAIFDPQDYVDQHE